MAFKANYFVAATLVAVVATPTVANAASYPNLLKQGYSVGKLGPGKSGNLGWVLSNGDQKFFCRMNAGVAYAGKKDMVSFTTSGRMIKLDRAVFEASIGGPDPSIPQLADLKAGRAKPADVGACAALR